MHTFRNRRADQERTLENVATIATLPDGSEVELAVRTMHLRTRKAYVSTVTRRIVTREPGGVSYAWDPHEDVVRVLYEDAPRYNQRTLFVHHETAIERAKEGIETTESQVAHLARAA